MSAWIGFALVFLAGIGIRLIMALGLWQFRRSSGYIGAYPPKKVNIIVPGKSASLDRKTKRENIIDSYSKHDRIIRG
ncbi:MAG: hypothetical protein HPY52_11450 [Firmicutes bacterium]|nr:hypothetical protein [Bacillota bacterium]